MTREELLRRLIAFDSRSQVSNRGIADFVCDYLDGPGVRIVRNQSADGTEVHIAAAPISESPAMATPETAPIHDALCALARQTGSRAVSFTTDGGWLGTLGLDLAVAEFERAAGPPGGGRPPLVCRAGRVTR